MAHRIPMPPKKAAKAKRDEGFNWDAEYPPLKLPVRPPFPPMEARSRDELPQGDAWLYEPKWDGFRCLAFRDGEEVILQSKAGQPLGRYFPEIVEAVGKLAAEKFALDGEIVIEIDGHLDFDALLQRIHPAASRIQRLSKETPAKYLCFDLLVDAEARDLTREPLRDRKIQLEEFSRRVLTRNKSIEVPPWSRELKDAEKWLHELAEYGCDGIVAKLAEEPYHSGDREAMVKMKRMRTADCVVGGFRYATKKENGIGSLLLGLYNDAGQLDHIGFCSSFTAPQRLELVTKLKPLIGGSAFTGKAPGGPSRWNAYNERSAEWVALDPKLVVEVQYDHFSGGRFRHGTKFLRWRPDKAPKQCTMEQVRPAGKRAA